MEKKIYKVEDPLAVEYCIRDKAWKMTDIHHHNSYELYFLESGARNIIANGKYHDIDQYDAFLINPNTLHRTDGNTAHSRITIYFTDDYINAYLTETAKKVLLENCQDRVVSLPKDKFFEIKCISKVIEEDIESDDPFVFLRLFRIFEIVNRHIGLKKENTDSSIPRIMKKIMEFINENYIDINDISIVSDHFNITKNYLCHLFKKTTSITVIQYINTLKIQKSCEMLTDTNRSVTEIGLECGFNSAMYFCKVFKNQMNMTPNEFRRTVK